MKSMLQDNDIEINSTYNEGKSVAVERFIRILKNKIDKYMTSVSKNVYIYNLADVVNKYHSPIKMKPFDIKSSTYIDFNKENDKEEPKLEVGDHVRISKHKNVLIKGYVPNWSEEVFVIKKVKNAVPWTYIISDFNWEEIAGTFSLEFKK